MLKEAVIFVFIANSILLILHELESAFEKEWEILRLPGNLTGFILLHIPILLVLFYGIVWLERNSVFGFWLAIVTGFGGLMPFIVHKVLVRRPDRFNRTISNILIYTNITTGIGLVTLSTVWLMAR